MPRSVQYARCETNSAYMSGDFAVSYATRLFGAEAVANLPRISRGKRKGLIKGMLSWTKCTVGGWQHRGAFGGGVVYPGFVSAEIEVDGVKVVETRYPTHEKKMAREAEEKTLLLASEVSWCEATIAEAEEKEANFVTCLRVCDEANIPADVRDMVIADRAKNSEWLAAARDKLAEKLSEAA